MSATAWLSKKLGSGKILCQACAQSCKLDEGEYGICGIRKVEDGELKLLVYGLASVVNIDPVEKKPMFNFLPGSRAFSFGTVGCNFSCKFCQNFDISQYPKEHNHQILGKEYPPERIVELAMKTDANPLPIPTMNPSFFLNTPTIRLNWHTKKG